MLQVHGGARALAAKVRAGGPAPSSTATRGPRAPAPLGYYPWFFTYGWLDRRLPRSTEDTPLIARLGRHASMGFAASAVSDTVSNAVRVVKVCRQTHPTPISYIEAARRVISEDGVRGLLGRGLRTKILANGVQGATFSVAWRCIESWWKNEKKEDQ